MYFSEAIPTKPLTTEALIILPYEKWIKAKGMALSYPAFSSYEEYSKASRKSDQLNFIFIQADQPGILKQIESPGNVVFILRTTNVNYIAAQRRFLFEMIKKNIKIPVILQQIYHESELEALQIKASAENGPVFVDGLAEGLFLQNKGEIQEPELTNLSLGILQASRIRIFKTEFISCPGCGRTQFDLEEAVKEVRKKTGHLKGLKIAVMGCVVNGPGEMADADYGYVGAGRGKVFLYKNKTLVKKNIPEEKALDELVALIKANGDWNE